MDAAVIATLVALISAFGSVMIALLLYCLKTIDDKFTTVDGRINKHTDKIDCIDRKVMRLGIMVGLAHPEIVKRESPFKIQKDDTVKDVVERFMNEGEGEGGENDDEGSVLGEG